MPRHGKRYRAAAELVDSHTRYGLGDAVRVLLAAPKTNFDETVELHAGLGVDPTHQEQQVRGTVTLPHGTGKDLRVIAFASGDAAQQARDAGAAEVGTEDLAKRIQAGWLDFDAAVATPDNMRVIGPLGRILGPRGLMPNARAGTVTNDIGRAVNELKAGRVEFRLDRLANVHVAVGKVSMGEESLRSNLASVIDALMRARPSATKGTYLQGLAIASAMGPGISLDVVRAPQEAAELAK